MNPLCKVKTSKLFDRQIKKFVILDSFEGDPVIVVVILTVFYGLRRSEILGIKWNAIDWDTKMLQIKHKIIENKTS